MTPDTVAALLVRLRERRPLVHNITNYVAMDVSANALLAVGCSPAMVHAREEAADFAAISDALSINIGTLSPPWVEAMHAAAERAAGLGKPWVLDPVGVGATAYRTATSADLARRGPTAVRANASEILALAQGTGHRETGGVRGVDSSHASDQAVDAARALARTTGGIVAVTGAVDYVTDGDRLVQVSNGHEMMTRVTALGCTASAIVAAFLAVGDDPLEATAAALAVTGLAGERAAAASTGPGSFRVAFMDALHGLSPDEAAAGARLG
ncbi:hydroxyethylthiazole kinase [Arenibaculum sp.]|jgi:hydroxyethylthiazole kinase|uniref:hydroxyethylthiazole kinase n=1 Tax=Arenibaculum sp. TaxID=2865862 RepID=UPI002E122822|nr:hydroxyethylthiazole kinase [Arenibaculum sp.]